MRIGQAATAAIIAGLTALVGLGCGAPGIQRLDTTGIAPVPVNAADAERLRNLPPGEGVILHIAAGQTIPVEVDVDLGAVRWRHSGSKAVARDDVYILLRDGGAWISPDLREWAALGDGGAMKRLFGIRGGRMQIGMAVTADGPSIRFAIEHEAVGDGNGP
jgi:hypothetical protein